MSDSVGLRSQRPAPWVVVIAYMDLPSDARLIRQARETRRLGARVTIVVPKSDAKHPIVGLEDCEVVWLQVPQERGRTTIRGQFRFMSALRRWCRSQSSVPDVVHIHNMPDYLCWAVRKWQKAGARIVLDVRDFMSHLATHRFRWPKRSIAVSLLGSLERRVWHSVDHIITVHEPYKRVIVSAGIEPTRVSVVLNTPDPDVVRAELRKPPPADLFKIVFHGTVAERTGVLNAVKAMPLVVAAVPEARLEIAGTGNASRAVHEAIASLGLEHIVTYTDRYLPLSAVIPLIADAHAAVVPNQRSRYTDLVLPVKLTEYAVLGIPAVATRIPLIEQYFGADAVHLIDEPTETEIAAALIKLAHDREYRMLLAERGRRFAMAHGWDQYRRVLASALELKSPVSLLRAG